MYPSFLPESQDPWAAWVALISVFSPQPDTSLHCQNTELVHRAVCFFMPQHSLVLILPTYASQQGSVATQLRWGGVFSDHFIANYPQNLERIAKIGKYLAKIWTKV